MFWVRYRLEYLRNWRSAVEAVAKAVQDVEPNAWVYVIGGAAEDRLTVLSDVDVLVCVEPKGRSLGELRRRILITAMDRYGLPLDYPIELHIHTPTGCKEILKHLKKYILLTPRKGEEARRPISRKPSCIRGYEEIVF